MPRETAITRSCIMLLGALANHQWMRFELVKRFFQTFFEYQHTHYAQNGRLLSRLSCQIMLAVTVTTKMSRAGVRGKFREEASKSCSPFGCSSLLVAFRP